MTRVRKFNVPNHFGDRSGGTDGVRSKQQSHITMPAEPWHQDAPAQPKRQAAPLRRGASHTYREPKERYGKAGE